MLQELIEDVTPDIRALGIAGDHLDDNHIRWWLLPDAIDYIIDNINDGQNLAKQPKRANGESWGFVGYEGVPRRVIMGHNGNGSKENHFWTYKYTDYSMWDQCGRNDVGRCYADGRMPASAPPYLNLHQQ